MKKRGLGKGVSALNSVALPKQPLSHLAGNLVEGALQQNRSLISVLRTKGGSGESHVVKAVLDAIINEYKSALVVHENPDRTLEKYVGNTWNYLEQDPSATALICSRWDEFFKDGYTHFLKSTFDSIIFTLGTTYGTNITTLKEMANISDVVFLSVSSDVRDSVEPAVIFSQYLLEDSSVPTGNIFIFCWYKKWSDDHDKIMHRYKIYDVHDFINIVDLENVVNLVPYTDLGYDDITNLLSKKLKIFSS